MGQEMYFLYLDGVQRGPYTVHQIGHMVNSGLIDHDSLFWCEGLDQWQPVRQLVVPKTEIRKNRFKLVAVLLCVLALIGAAVWLATPSLKEGWMEQHQIEVSPKAAYWRARGVLREHLGKLRAVRFSGFEQSKVLLADPKHASVELMAFSSAGRNAVGEERWLVAVEYDERLKMWVAVGEPQRVVE